MVRQPVRRGSGVTSRGRGSAALVRVLLPGVTPAMSSRGRRRQLAAGIPTPTLQQAWLLLAVLGRSLPLSSEVEAARRLARHQGMPALLASIARARRRPAAWFRRS
ncbi:MAG: hypothetical protein QOI02_873, partial [Actinomycetota bacterium]|nr:hypothetical protein [Actinomycetota bacterium]